ncbi:DNA-protecting protein DprA [bacterium (Candidatus Howlettbacteria) CG_4_10_14_0_8_um_filter_40_9]|nr:MAG: DNA-protecting protein DprA [bacterium (Candidatus Howlettbacteria) CG_4_10_14_0_8_um_filter_40_9]
MTKDFASDLVLKGITIVSGLALGIDTAAHEAALSAGGRTIAVLGNGVEKPYPPSNANLAEKIIKNGAIISEFPIGTLPLRQNFPARNRIISGLSLGTLVTEAHEGSGSLITAGYTLEQNREVFAVPGSLYNKNSIGPNNLIKMGAKTVTSADDILEEMGWEQAEANSKAKKIFPSSPEEKVILGILENEPSHIDAIIKESGFESSQASSVLTIMEVKGKVKHLGGMVYRINN